MVKIEKENIVLIILILVLVLGIFVSSNPESLDVIRGKVVGITGKATGDGCVEVDVKRLQELRNLLDEKAYFIGNFLSWKPLPESPTTSDYDYIYQIIYNLYHNVAQYYWDISPIENGNPMQRYSVSWADKYREWTSIRGSCITKEHLEDFEEMEELASLLEWIFLPIGDSTSDPLNSFYYAKPKTEFRKYVWDEDGSSFWTKQYGSFDGAWEKTLNKFNSDPGAEIEGCNNAGYWGAGTEQIDSSSDKNMMSGTAMIEYEKCTIGKIDLTSLPFEIADSKLYYNAWGWQSEYGNSPWGGSRQFIIESAGTIKVGDIGAITPDIGAGTGRYYLADIPIENKVYNDVEFEVIVDNIKPNVIAADYGSQPIRYYKGLRDVVFRGFIVNPYGNVPPDVEVELKVEDNPNRCFPEKQEPTVCDNLICTAKISDPDKEDSQFSASFVISGGTGVLAKTMPILKGEDKCYSNPCEIKFKIPKIYTNYNDEIVCKVVPSDNKIKGDEKSISISIPGKMCGGQPV